jgi:hypothetical protein
LYRYAELAKFLDDVTARGGEERDGDPILGAQMTGNMVAAVPSGQFSTLLDMNRTGPVGTALSATIYHCLQLFCNCLPMSVTVCNCLHPPGI